MTYYHLIPEQPLPPPLPPPPRPRGQNPVHIVYYTTPTIAYNFVPHYDKDTSASLGSTQILLACISIAAGVMAILYGAGCYEVGIGLWAGIWYIIAGSYAIAAGNDPTNSVITATLVFSVFDILFGVTQLTIASIGITNELYCYEGDPPFYRNYSGTCVDWWKGAVAANTMMIGVGSLEIITGVLLTAISSRAISEGSKPQFAYFATIPVTFTPNQQEPVFIQGPSPRPNSAHLSQPPPTYDQLQHPWTSNQPEPAFVQRTNPLAHLSQPPPSYDQIQRLSTSTQRQMMYVGVQQDPWKPFPETSL